MINFENASFKDFENLPHMNLLQRSTIFNDYLNYTGYNDGQTYRVVGKSGCAPEMELDSRFGTRFISFVSNDYLGFTQHAKVKTATINGIEKYGTGAGASPLIGGFFDYHRILEKKIANFFGRDDDSSVIFTTGYTANSATLLCLLQMEDVAIVDLAVHASVHEGCILTNKKTFLHNDTVALERILASYENKYRTKLVIVDGVYSQDGDVAPLKEIVRLCKKYNANVMVDDAHGVGILGKTGRGALEVENLLDEVDFITGTFSKTFGSIGGYVICNPIHASFLKFQSRQQIFSATAGAATLGIIKAIELIDEEPQWQASLLDNIEYFRTNLQKIGLNVGLTNSAIIPIKIGDPVLTKKMATILLENGIYTNPILYPAVSKKDGRIRMSLSALHTKDHLDKTLNIFDHYKHRLTIRSSIV
jgi:glycine C-acetyltransferase